LRSDSTGSRTLRLGADCCALPEDLLLAHGRGEVLFITGAGSSMQSGLPDFKQLVLNVYAALDAPLHKALLAFPPGTSAKLFAPTGLQPLQIAEGRRYLGGDFDVALGMLERRLDGEGLQTTKVRQAISQIISSASAKPSKIHRAIVSLADRGVATAVVTTNFDLLLEQVSRKGSAALRSYSLASIPRPGRSPQFSGVMHIHGMLEPKSPASEYFIVSDRDFGEFYLRRQVVPDFIYDAARLYSIVLVGYSATDPPMRYLLNAVAADGVRFSDLKPRYAFVPSQGVGDDVVIADWSARGIEPIPYDSSNGHRQLPDTLAKWARMSAVNGDLAYIKRIACSIAKRRRSAVSEFDRDLLDYLYRRGSNTERLSLISSISKAGANPEWLDAWIDVSRGRA